MANHPIKYFFSWFDIVKRYYFYDVEQKLTRCTLVDLDTLAKVSRATFISAFERENNPQDFKSYLDDAFNPSKLSQELQHPQSHFYFLHLNNRLAGYLKVNEEEAQSDINDSNSLELERIYVLESFQSRGLGTWLLHQIFDLARKFSKQYVWLGVWERNQKAIKFYQRHGFKKFAEHPYYIGKDEQTDWLMRYDLD